jgi:hypothetical protein
MFHVCEFHSRCSTWFKGGKLYTHIYKVLCFLRTRVRNSRQNLRPELHSHNIKPSNLFSVTGNTYLNIQPMPFKSPGCFLPGLFLLSKTAFSEDCLAPPRTDAKALGSIPDTQSLGIFTAGVPSSSATVWGKNWCLGSRCQACSSCLRLVSNQQLPTSQANNTKRTRVSIQLKLLAEENTVPCLQF